MRHHNSRSTRKKNHSVLMKSTIYDKVQKKKKKKCQSLQRLKSNHISVHV